MVRLMSDWFWVFNFSPRHLVFVFGVRARDRPRWGLPQSVLSCLRNLPPPNFPELKCHSDL